MNQCPYCKAEVAQGAAACFKCGKAQPEPAVQGRSSGCGALTLVSLVGGAGIFLLIGFFLALLIVPDFVASFTQRHQRRQDMTRTNLEALNAVFRAYSKEVEEIPPIRDMDDLESRVVPAYFGLLPTRDGWRNEVRFSCWAMKDRPEDGRAEATTERCESFAFISAGSDGAFEHEAGWMYETEVFDPEEHDRDIVLVDGAYLQYPRSFEP